MTQTTPLYRYVKSLLCTLTAVMVLAFTSIGLSANIVDTDQQGDIAYFLYDSPARVARYDLKNQAFLSSINLDASATASIFEVDEDGLFVVFGDHLSRFNFDGTNPAPLLSSENSIDELVSNEEYLFAGSIKNSDNLVTSISKASNLVVASNEYFDVTQGWSLARGANKLLGSTRFRIVGAGLRSLQLSSGGLLPSSRFAQVSPLETNEYRPTRRTYVLPDESGFVDSNGIIFSISDLSYLNSFNRGFIDIGFSNDTTILLRSGGNLVRFSSDVLEVDRASFNNSSIFKIALNGDFIYGFYKNGDDLGVEVLALSTFSPRSAGTSPEANSLAYTPDQIESSANGIVYLLSNEHKSVFRWSLAQEKYIKPIALLDDASHIEYSDVLNTLFIGYPNGIINKVVGTDTPQQEFFAKVPLKLTGLFEVDNFLVAVDQRSSSRAFHVFNASGELVNRKMFARDSKDYVWNSAIGRFYQLDGRTGAQTLFSLPISGGGTVGDPRTEFITSPSISGRFDTIFPIVPNSDGTLIAVAPNHIASATTLETQSRISERFIDAAWIDRDLYTISDNTDRVQRWAFDGDQVKKEVSFSISGTPITLFTHEIDSETNLIVVSITSEGKPKFELIVAGDFKSPPDDFLLTYIPTLIGALNAPVRNAKWAVENNVICRSIRGVGVSESTVRVTIDEVSLESTSTFNNSSTRSDFVEATPGLKTINARFTTSSLCRSGSFTQTTEFKPGLRYLLKLVPDGGSNLKFEITTVRN